MKSPEQLVNEVKDEESFLVFAKALVADRIENVGGWENTTISDYLEAGIAWAEDSHFGTKMAFSEYEIKEENLWMRFAAFLMAAKIYE